jgi:hypothetical protein
MRVQYIKSQEDTGLTFRNIETVDSRQNRAMDRRIDRRTQVYIDAVLNSLPSIGQREAALVLRELGIPIETAVRVLTRPTDTRMAGRAQATNPSAPTIL